METEEREEFYPEVDEPYFNEKVLFFLLHLNYFLNLMVLVDGYCFKTYNM